MTEERDRLLSWQDEPDALSMQNPDSWYLGGDMQRLPRKRELAAGGPSSLMRGWMPSAPVIARETKVIGLGSCFAQYFILWLAEAGFNRNLDMSPYNALMRYGSMFESAAVIAQQFRWAFGGFDDRKALWIGKDKELFEATEERRALVRNTLAGTDVLVLTLGLSEIWYDNEADEPLWRALTRRHYNPQRHVFRVETVHDTKRHLERIEAIRREHLPQMKIVYTVSPVRLAATFRPASAVTANSASKAIIRAALDEFLREHAEVLNRELFYFPSFEIVHDFFRDAFEEDNRHVTPFVAGQVVRTFAAHYCRPELLSARIDSGSAPGSAALDAFLGSASLPPVEEHTARIRELERRIEDLQRICDERQEVIETLDSAARERLALIESLHEACAALQRQIPAKK